MSYLSFNRNDYSTYCRVFRECKNWEQKRNAERHQNTVQHGENYDAKIRRGEFAYAALVGQAEALLSRVEAAFATSGLPAAPNRKAAEKLLIWVRQAWYAEQKR